MCILMAAYNGAAYIGEQIRSVLSQTYADFELHISDDGSTDETVSIIKEFMKADPRIKLLEAHRSTGGAKNNFFYLLEHVQGDVFLFCDQDDVWTENHCEALIKKYLECNEHSAPVLVHSDLTVVDKNLNIKAKSFFDSMKLPRIVRHPHFYFTQNNVTGCVSLINNVLKTYVLSDIQQLKENLNSVPMHDMFFASIAAMFGKILFVDEQLEYYRQHGNNAVGAKNVNSIIYLRNKIFNNADMVNSILSYRKYAGFFALYFSDYITQEELHILRMYADLGKYPKIERISFLMRNKFLKFGFARNLLFFGLS